MNTQTSSPYSAPLSSLVREDNGEDLLAYKKIVVQDPDGQWPSRCFKCNASASVKKSLKLFYVNPWIYLTILISPLITIIVALVVRKKFIIDLPVCEVHLEKRRNMIIAQFVMLFLAIGCVVLAAMFNQDLMIAVAIILFLGIVIIAIASRRVYIVKLKDDKLWIKGAGKKFLDQLASYQK